MEKIGWAEATLNAAPPATRELLAIAASDIRDLVGDLGAQCLREAVTERRPEFLMTLAQLGSDHDRAAFVWLNDQDLFDEATRRVFLESRQPSATWTSAFLIPVGTSIANIDLKPHLMPIVDDYGAGAPGVAVESYALEGILAGRGPTTLVSIYYEGRYRRETRLVKGEITAVAARKVHKVAVHIESGAGVMYVVSDNRSPRFRAAIAHVIARQALGLKVDPAQLPQQEYNLQRLLDRREFTWDREHRIEMARVSSLTLWAPMLGRTEVQARSSGRDPEDVRPQALATLNPADRPLAQVLGGELYVKFGPGGGRSSRVVRIRFNGPHSVALNLKRVEDSLVRARYFPRWELLGRRAVAALAL